MNISFLRIRANATEKGFALLYSLASQVSALATLGSLPFGKATHASVVLRSMSVSASTRGHKSATFAETQQHRAFLPFFTPATYQAIS